MTWNLTTRWVVSIGLRMTSEAPSYPVHICRGHCHHCRTWLTGSSQAIWRQQRGSRRQYLSTHWTKSYNQSGKPSAWLYRLRSQWEDLTHCDCQGQHSLSLWLVLQSPSSRLCELRIIRWLFWWLKSFQSLLLAHELPPAGTGGNTEVRHHA